jgi:hypothetical protein
MHEQADKPKRILKTAEKPGDFIIRRMTDSPDCLNRAASLRALRSGMASSCYTAARFPTMTVHP